MINNPILNQKPIKINRALISVYDKSNVVVMAQTLKQFGIEILSTGGTAKTLREAKIPVTEVSDYTQFPEIMDGRVKTINPMIEGGILGLRDKHNNDADANGIKWIDLVVCNLYPFSQTISQENCDIALAMENVDIGGPTMIRSAAKNIGWVCVVVHPDDYKEITEELNSNGELSFETRRRFSSKAFGHTAQYESIIHNYLKEESFTKKLSLTYIKHSKMRYGENPHQQAAAYQIPGNAANNILNATIHQGKMLSYNNIMDADAALACLKEFDEIACVIVKHANPCGAATGNDLLDVYSRAFNTDSLSAFGGIIALNRKCTEEVAIKITKVFVEIVLAPAYDPKALTLFSKKKNLRILEVETLQPHKKRLEVRNINGGVLLQETNISTLSSADLTIITKTKPNETDIETMLFGWKILKHVRSNGILLVKENTTVGIGAGQVSRVDAVDIAIRKAGDNLPGSILCSDAFFPFRDSIDKIAGTGVKAVIQPGGSVRDQEVVDACNEHGISMVFTGQRCFKH